MKGNHSDRALVWLRNGDYSAESITQAYTRLLRQKILPTADWVYTPEAVSEQFVSLQGLEDGSYTLELYDPQTSSFIDTETLVVTDGQVTINLGILSKDLAFKLFKD